MMTHPTALEVRDLVVEFTTESGVVRAVDQVSFQLKKNSVLGIAGESGCGKSVTALSILRLLPRPAARIVQGSVCFQGQDLLRLPVKEMYPVRGKKIAMIFQDPMTALNPVHDIGRQMMEIYRLHFPGLPASDMRASVIQLLVSVGIPDTHQIIGKFPHQLSGGMRQRVMIAMALACEPDILIADEPTTALDVTIQAQILDLIRSFQRKTEMAMILITHDLGVIAETSDDVVIMYAGKIVEKADVRNIFKNPQHPYTRGLLKSIPSLAKTSKSSLPTIRGNVPSLMELPDGCRFAPRCPWVADICRKTIPKERCEQRNHAVACHFAGQRLD